MVKKNRLSMIILIVIFIFNCSFISLEGYAQVPDIQGRYILLIDSETDRVLYEKNAHYIAYPASTTKVMTALLIIEAIEEGRISLYDRVVATETAAVGIPYDGSSLKEEIKVGEVLTVANYLHAIMMNSDTYSCHILAEYVSGSVENFVADMNRKAQELGCSGTNFTNTTGYPDIQHYTTAYSIYLFSKEAMKYEIFRNIVSTYKYVIKETDMSEEREIFNTNWLLGMPEVEEDVTPLLERYYQDYFYAPCLGIKTGTTSAAGNCLVSAATIDGKEYYAVILGAVNVKKEDGRTDRESFSETIRLYEWGFYAFEERQVLSQGDKVGEIRVLSKSGHKSIEFFVKEDFSDMVLIDKAEEITYNVVYDPLAIFHQEILFSSTPYIEVYQGDKLITRQELDFVGAYLPWRKNFVT